MKKKALSLALALVMCLGLTVPAFADTIDVDVAFSVDPIGVATIKSERGDFENVYVFDQDGTITIKDGRRFTDFYDYDLLSDLLGEIGDGGGSLGEQDAEIYAERDGVTFYTGKREDFTIWGRSPYVCSKTYLDKLIAAGYDVEFKPYTASQPTTPTRPETPVQPEQPSQPSVPNVPDAPGSYTVKKGDTWSRICTNFYGDNSQRYALMKANKNVKLKEGAVITLPEKLGKAVLIPAPAAGNGEKLYTVKAGDTLGKIAAAEYGKVSEYKAIFERNKDRLKNANLIYEGQVIVLPIKK